jgi:3-isopropylmalate/(R)-2-methylmalate dehydratase small subunit
MQAFTSHTGTAVPLRRSDIDTDQIIPAVYLKRVSRTGFGDGLFAAWRSQPGFVLDDPAYAGASVLLAGRDFGTGSSREHAVWALQDYGFRAVVSPRFGDIFRTNALKNGLLPVILSDETVEALMDAVQADPATEITIDLADTSLRAGQIAATFELDEHTRWRLTQGLDDVALTLRHAGDIDEFESRRPARLPTTTPLLGAARA